MLRHLGKVLGPPRPARPEPEAVALAYATRLLSHARDEINKADAKAQVLLGIVGIAIGAVAGGLAAGGWSPFQLSDGVEWLWWTGVALALGSLACLAGAVYPRLNGARPGDDGIDGEIIEYFGDVVRFESGQALAEALMSVSEQNLQRLSGQVRRVSQIVSRKYLLIRWGFWLLTGAIFSTVVAIGADMVLRGG
ncbi:Pycsar system effector family protein [Sphaerisporangium aureirubrum]|uniref:Pycsar system effector family protein n=1 Tax=Sphaerisporangium aureirubrum TaxID=1544736 RepID=A0ABW1NNX7_9ACTN